MMTNDDPYNVFGPDSDDEDDADLNHNNNKEQQGKHVVGTESSRSSSICMKKHGMNKNNNDNIDPYDVFGTADERKC
jgi:hypothetical protein